MGECVCDCGNINLLSVVERPQWSLLTHSNWIVYLHSYNYFQETYLQNVKFICFLLLAVTETVDYFSLLLTLVI